MPPYRSVKLLETETAAYIAGLVDGEGTITLTAERRGERRRLVVSISNTDLALLQFVLEKVGVGRITTKRTYRPQHAPGYAYRVTNRQALELLRQLHRYLRTYRAERAALVLARYIALTPRNGKYTVEMLRRRQLFESELLATLPYARSRSGSGELRECRESR